MISQPGRTSATAGGRGFFGRCLRYAKNLSGWMLQGVPRGSNAKISRDNQDAFEESGGKTKLSGRGAAFIKWLCSDLTKHG